MKKTISLTLIFILVISSITLVNASEQKTDITKEQAVEYAKKYIHKAWDYNVSDLKPLVILDDSSDTADCYLVTFKDDDNDSELYIDIRVDLKSGEVIYALYDYYGPKEDKELNIIAEDQAKKIADDFFEKTNPTIYKQTKYNYSTYDIERKNVIYNFLYSRVYKDSKVNKNYVWIQVDGQSKKVIRYRCYWDKDDINYIKNNLTKYKAEKIIKETLNIKPKFKSVYNDNGDTEYVITYETDLKNIDRIDATTGKALTRYGEEIDLDTTIELTKLQKNKIYQKTIEDSKTPLTEEELKVLFKQHINEFYGVYGDITINTIVPNLSEHPSKSILCKFSVKNEDVYNGEMLLDKYSGKLLDCMLDVGYKELAPATKDEWQLVYEKAIDLIAKYYPEYINDINTRLSLYNIEYNILRFNRVVNNIEFPYNGISIVINPKNLNIIALNLKWDDDVKLPSSENIMSVKEATDLYFKNYSGKTLYLKSNNFNAPVKYSLVYIYPIYYYYGDVLDATTGAVISEYGEYYPDYDRVGKFEVLEKVLDVITYKTLNRYKMVDLLFTDINEDDDNYIRIKRAVNFNVIDNVNEAFNAKKYVTRIELAEMIARALGYHEIAQDSSVFKPPFSDYKHISKDSLGHAIICHSLNILKTENNKFRPSDLVTRLELELALLQYEHIYDNR